MEAARAGATKAAVATCAKWIKDLANPPLGRLNFDIQLGVKLRASPEEGTDIAEVVWHFAGAKPNNAQRASPLKRKLCAAR